MVNIGKSGQEKQYINEGHHSVKYKSTKVSVCVCVCMCICMRVHTYVYVCVYVCVRLILLYTGRDISTIFAACATEN